MDLHNRIILILSIVLIYGSMHLAGITCPIRYITGISCAGCGMTRAAFAFLQGHFQMSFYYHPLLLMMPVILLIYVFRDKLGQNHKTIITWLLIGLFIVVYVYRMMDPSDQIVVFDPENGLIFRLLTSWK